MSGMQCMQNKLLGVSRRLGMVSHDIHYQHVKYTYYIDIYTIYISVTYMDAIIVTNMLAICEKSARSRQHLVISLPTPTF